MTSATLTAAAVVATLSFAGCGSSASAPITRSEPTTTASSASPACLTPDEVNARVNKIASGFETSDAEVAHKQQVIREVRARVCR